MTSFFTLGVSADIMALSHGKSPLKKSVDFVGAERKVSSLKYTNFYDSPSIL